MQKPHLYTNPRSRGRTVRWLLEELAIPYDVTILKMGEDNKKPDYLKLNPMGKVPTLVHKDKVITETAAICAYLADAYKEKGLFPKENEMADYYRWFFFASGPLESALINKFMGVAPNDKQRGMTGYGSLELVTDVLDNTLKSKPFITGERFTACDIYLGAQLNMGIQFELLEKRATFKDYLERLQSREAFIKAASLDKID